jgi:hypothetical protein
MSGIVSPALGTPPTRMSDMLLVDLSYNTPPATRPAIVDRFVAMNVLIALLMIRDQDRFDYQSSTLYTFRSALEYSASAPEHDEEVPDYPEMPHLSSGETC